MRDESDREALFAALEADAADAVSLNALGDWFEENGDHQAAGCLRWVTRNARRPFHYPRPSEYGPYLWIRQGEQPIIEDRQGQLPETLWVTLEGNDEKTPVASFKSYRTARAAYESLLAAWRALEQAPADMA